MKRPGRLFWKLYVVFWLATISAFAIGLTLFESTMPRPWQGDASHVTINLGALADVVREDGIGPLLPLLRQNQEPNGRLALFDQAGRFMAGNRAMGKPDVVLTVRDPQGRSYRLAGDYTAPRVINHLIPFAAGSIVSLVFSALVAWYAARPLGLLNEGLRAVAQGHLGTRVSAALGRRRDELGELATEFDRMAAHLQQLVEAQQTLFHDISHELRSPLARLEVAIGLMRQSPEQATALLPRIEQQTRRLDTLIEQVLTLARIEAGMADAPRARIDVMDLVTAIVDDAAFEAAVRQCQVVLTGAAPFVMLADGELLYRAFENVIRNAVRHAPAGSTITVAATMAGATLSLCVQDTGPGVTHDMVEAIFEPFKRLDGAGPAASEGFGLGLAIARQAIMRHGGTIKARSNGQSGLNVIITLPRQPD